jgi:hypothetical protein
MVVGNAVGCSVLPKPDAAPPALRSNLQVQGLGAMKVDCGRIDPGIKQNEDRLTIHRSLDADLRLREVKRDVNWLPQSRIAPEPK